MSLAVVILTASITLLRAIVILAILGFAGSLVYDFNNSDKKKD